MESLRPDRNDPAQGVDDPWTYWGGTDFRVEAPSVPGAEGGTAGEEAPRPGLARMAADGVRVAAVSLVLYVLFFNLSVVRGSSMAPGIHDGDRILVEPWSYVVGDVSRGDVVVLQYPLDPRVDYIKRVIGVPGDHVVMADGYVWVNGELLTEPYVDDVDHTSYTSCIVDEGHVFVLGDNRPRSSDSREFGLVPVTYLRGRVDLRLWPLSRVGWIR